MLETGTLSTTDVFILALMGATPRATPVVGGRVFVGSQDGIVYSLDASTGYVYWSINAGGIVRRGVGQAFSLSNAGRKAGMAA